MGLQGVVVGRSDRVWTRHAVGRYSPTDFSFFAKTRLLLSNVGFLAAALAISLSMTGVALSLSQYRRQDFPLLAGVPVSVLSLLIVLPVALAVTGQRAILEMILRLWLTLAFALTVSAIVLAIVSKDDRVSKSAGLTIGILALLASCWSMLVFSGSDADPSRNYTLFMPLYVTAAFVLGMLALAVARHQLRHWRAVLPTMLGMNLLVVLAFMLWLHLGIALALSLCEEDDAPTPVPRGCTWVSP